MCECVCVNLRFFGIKRINAKIHKAYIGVCLGIVEIERIRDTYDYIMVRLFLT